MKLHLPALFLFSATIPALAATPAVTPAKSSTKPDSILLDTMQAELTRAMASLGTTPPALAFCKLRASPRRTTRRHALRPARRRPRHPPAALAQALLRLLLGRRRRSVLPLRRLRRHHQLPLRPRPQRRRRSPPRLARRRQHPRRPSQLRAHHHGFAAYGRSRRASRARLWFATDRGYAKRASTAYLKVKTEQQVRAKRRRCHPRISPVRHAAQDLSCPPAPALDSRPTKSAPPGPQRLRELSSLFKQYPDVLYYERPSALQASTETDYFVSSEGARVDTPSPRRSPGRSLPAPAPPTAWTSSVHRDLRSRCHSAIFLTRRPLLAKRRSRWRRTFEELRNAPITEPFNGPAILSGRASAVFFHEVLGHRLEGQRQRGDEEGQTFTKLLGKPILPSFLSVADDPTLLKFDGKPLSGHYSFDDEGQPARRVDLIQDGVLEDLSHVAPAHCQLLHLERSWPL